MSSGPSRVGSALGWLVAVALFGLGSGLMFRFLPLHSIGDNGDSLIATATLEHWCRVALGRAADWRSPGWFWPIRGAVGLTDSFLLLAVPFGLVRAAGVGPFGALTATVASLSAAGFWGMLVLLRRLGVPAALGGAMGFVLAFGAVATFKLSHLQTYTMMLAPWVGVLLLAGWRRRGGAGALLAGAGGALFGLMTLTAPQTGWFLGLETSAAGVLAVLLGVRVPWRDGSAWGVALAALAGAGLGLAPIPAVYAAGIGEGRAWSEVAFYLPNLGDIATLPPGSLLWSGLQARLRLLRPDIASETALGFTPALACCAVGAMLGWPWLRRAAGPHAADRPALAFLLVAVLAWLATAQLGEETLWYWVWAFVPGGSAVRTPFRIQLASYALVLLALGHLAARALCAAARRGGAGAAAALGAALALVVVEQIGPAPAARDTWLTARWLIQARRPDFPCRAFYVLPPAPGPERWYEYQSEAMLLSVWLGLPTINGNSSWVPVGWDLRFPDQPDYAAHALDWIEQNGGGAGLCGVDVRTGRWVAGIGPLREAADQSARH